MRCCVMAFSSVVLTCSWLTTSANVCGRYLRAMTDTFTSGSARLGRGRERGSVVPESTAQTSWDSVRPACGPKASGSPLCETVERRARAHVDPAVQNRGRCEGVFVEIVDGENLPLRGCPQHHDFPVF